MKSIIILGVPRSGKSTLAKMLKEKYPIYNIIEEDIINESLRRIIASISKKDEWETALESTKALDGKVGYFLDVSLMFEPKYSFILDTTTIKPKICRQFQKKGVIVVVLGYPNETKESILSRIREYENENDWTTVNSNLIMWQFVDYWLEESKNLEQNAKKYGLKFVDTGKNRSKALAETMIWIDNQLKKEFKEV